MKKRLIALMAAVCLVIAPMSVPAEETDYSYLEDMSVKELKALRDAINEILGDGGGSVANSGSEYGSVTGSITYYYNDYKGHVADVNSTVILIPTDAENLDINTDGLIGMSVQSDFASGDGVYYAAVNGMGTFTINHIPAGEYLIWIASGNTNTGAWFDVYDGEDEEAIVPYYKSVAAQASGLLTEEDAYNIADAIGPNKSHYDNVTVYGGETTVFDYDFGYTYI